MKELKKIKKAMAKKTKKVVINSTFGGFSISRKCAEYMAKLGDKQADNELKEWKQRQDALNFYKSNGNFPKNCDESLKRILEIYAKYNCDAKFYGYGYGDGFDNGYDRANTNLIKAVEVLGKDANGDFSSLKVVIIPYNTNYYIDEYGGLETIRETHKTWS